MLRRGFKFRLYPTPAQAAVLEQTFGVCRLIYNLALEQRRDHWRRFKDRAGRHISFPSQCRELTDLRRDYDWIAAVSRTAQEQALRDLDTAFSRFFKGVARYPQPRRKGADDTFRLKGSEARVRAVNAKWAVVDLPKVPGLRFRLHRKIAGEIKSATITRKAGVWMVAFGVEGVMPAAAVSGGAVGIDRGVSTTLALSDGQLLAVPRGAALTNKIAAAQRKIARQNKGSGRYKRQRLHINALLARRARIRTHWLHVWSTQTASRYSLAVLENLNVAGMTASAAGTIDAPGKNVAQKAGLNRSILESGWAIFADMLTYKMEERGGHVVTVDPAYTSQTCSDCGVIDARSRESQARFACVACGHRDHADVNAAKNILRRNTAWLDVEATHQRACEASTGSQLAA